MKSKKVSQGKQVKQRHSAEFKQQALDRAERDGVAMAAKDLNLHASQLYAWRQKKQLDALSGDETRLMQAENARLKRELARLNEEHEFLKKAAAYFAKESKRGTP
jgi:transposase